MSKPVAETHEFVGHADAPESWCVIPDESKESGYCGQSRDAAVHQTGEQPERTLHAHFKHDGSVEVQGFLQFTKEELEDISRAVLLVASKRPHDYIPLARKDSR